MVGYGRGEKMSEGSNEQFYNILKDTATSSGEFEVSDFSRDNYQLIICMASPTLRLTTLIDLEKTADDFEYLLEQETYHQANRRQTVLVFSKGK